MELKQAISARYSVRKFLDKEVPIDLIAKILEVARFAPSSGNTQCWKFILVQDKNKKASIANACLEQSWIASAPLLIVVCNQHSKATSLYGKLGKMFSIQDCAIISSYLQLLAVDNGLGSCWIGAFDNEAVQNILQIPEDIDPEIILALGYPAEEMPQRNRSEIEYLTFFEKWGGKTNPLEKKKGVLQIAKEFVKGTK